VIATQTALKLADYVVTEAGFGADLGAEKFLDIKCRKSGLRPQAAVIVATVRALKHHGGVGKDDLNKENLAALEKGLVNLERHVNNVKNVYAIPCVVSVNRFTADTKAEMDLLTDRIAKLGAKVVVANHWAEGGKGAADLAKIVVDMCEQKSSPTFVYDDADPLWDKMKKIATKVYGASEITAETKVRNRIKELQEAGYGKYPVCVAKTQSSFSSDASVRGAPSGHVVNIREVRLAAGAEFVVMICGDIMTMPGLPKVPSAEKIDLTDDGKVVGLF
jgi:formate--tetrahydrofolate ligase